MGELYVNYGGLGENIDELKRWKSEFNALNDEFNQKLNEMNSCWKGNDYDSMKLKVSSELAMITGSDGKIQHFIEECIGDLQKKKDAYTEIQSKNASYWE